MCATYCPLETLRVLHLPFTPSQHSTGMAASHAPPDPRAKVLPHSLHFTCQSDARLPFFLLLNFTLAPLPLPRSLIHPQDACRVLFPALIYSACPHSAPTSLQKLLSSVLDSDSSAFLLKKKKRFIYFRLCWVLVVASGSYCLVVVHGLLIGVAFLLLSTGPVVRELQRLWLPGSRAQAQ